MLPAINPQKETRRIVAFIKETFRKQRINHAVIGLSGGVDSTTVYYLLKRALPLQNIIAVSLPYYALSTSGVENRVISIQKIVSLIDKTIQESEDADFLRLGMPEGREPSGDKKDVANFSAEKKIRLGNMMTRVRMVILYDLAKKHNALVVGTENKTEHLLGYFTRFGDAASDIEPLQHLYKTQVYQLAKYLGVPEKIIKQKPTAGLWPGQTDEGQFGFTYEEADQVLFQYFDQKKSVMEIAKGWKNTEKILDLVKKNEFKHQTPYLTDH